ncbi:MAG: hypothetical protein ABR541_02870 [Candidatus Dormibacteria bacterium]
MSPQPPGAPAPLHDRTVLVITDDRELAVSLRERVSRTLAVIRDAKPAEMTAVMRACRPWPWMVVGTVAELDAEVRATLTAHPVLVFWQGPIPAGLPDHARQFVGFSDVAESVSAATENRAAGLRLAPGTGVECGDGRLVSSANLQALVSAHPLPFHLPRRAFGSCGAALARAGVRLAAGPHGRGVVLAAAASSLSPRDAG